VVPDQTYNRPQSLQECAARLIDFGYLPVPIPAGCKGPTISGWDKLEITQEQVPDYWDQPGMLIGCLHRNVACFDIDVYDPELSRIILAEGFRRFPLALERVGEPPKSSIIMRIEEPSFRIRQTEKHGKPAPDGSQITAQVDVRSDSRQMVVYGKHPTTGKPYTWPRGELWATPRETLPLLTAQEAQSFRDWCNDTIRQWAGVQSPQVVSLSSFRGNAIATNEKPSEAAFLKALQHIPPSMGHDAGWLECLMGIHDFYDGSAQGLATAQSWSSADPRYSAHEVETKWRSFEVGKGQTYRTVMHYAKINGANLAAIAAMDKPQIKTERNTSGAYYSTGNYDDPFDGTTQSEPEPEPEAAERTSSRLEWFDDIKPVLTDSYTVKGVLGAGAMSVVYGPSNSGKTFFALDLAFHIAAGVEWRGFRVKQTCVLYLAAEGGSGVANRVAALKLATGATGLPFALRRAGMDLLHAEADLQTVYDLSREVMDAQPGLPLLIVIDTLSRVMAGGDENSPGDMTALIRNIDMIRESTGAHIMLVHHTGKDAAKGARGHSSLRAATDTEIEVQNEDGQRAAIVTKQRDYQGGEIFAFGLKGVSLGIDQDGEEVTSCVVEPADVDEFKASKKAAKGRGKNQQIIMETFDQMHAEGLSKGNPGGVGMPEAGQFWAVDANELRRIAQGKMTGDNAAKLFRTAWDALTAPDGLFVQGNNQAWRIDRRKK
jgi:hypothetical protein